MNTDSNYLKHFIMVMVVMTTSTMPVYSIEQISDLRWDARIILVFASEEPNLYVDQLKQVNDAIEERDIYWFVLSDNKTQTNYPKQLDTNFFSNTKDKYDSGVEPKVILIGKDGYIKESSNDLNFINIFDLIDAMPMRQFEMKQQKDY
ncbi:MAG: DUF4174 domain-containing protein [Pseudomonadota bacterium]